METRANQEGTARFAKRFAGKTAAAHFRDVLGLRISSVGIGTYLGAPTDADDRLYTQAIVEAVRTGCNVIDTAINYRCMRSERAIGAALRTLLDRGEIRREEIVVCTKGGYVPGDGAPPRDPAAHFRTEFLDRGLCQPNDLVAGCHVIAPRVLANQLGRSLANLGLDAVDVYYVHNPEQQLDEVDPAEFRRRMRDAFAALEEMVSAGKTRFYGTATWNGYRVAPESKEHLDLADLLGLAEQVGGKDHHFRVVQLPYSLAMPEALTKETQRGSSMLSVAEKAGLAVFASAPMLQSRLARGLPPVVREAFGNLETDAQRAIQFVRSTPGVAAPLCGMKQVAHVRENLAVCAVEPAPDRVLALFQA